MVLHLPRVYVCVCVLLLLLRIRCLWLLHIVHPSPVAFFRGRCVRIVKAMAADGGPHRNRGGPFESNHGAIAFQWKCELLNEVTD